MNRPQTNMPHDKYKKPTLEKLGNIREITFENGGLQSSAGFSVHPSTWISVDLPHFRV